MSKSLSIADAAKASGLGAHTLRYYEQIGLIGPVDRRGGARRYAADDMRWLEFLVRLRATGMPVRDMQRYARLLRQGHAPEIIAERQAMLEQHARRLDADMRTLGETLDYIRGKIRHYRKLQQAPKRA
jgi:DNA-binding transcriptional MerR regulator